MKKICKNFEFLHQKKKSWKIFLCFNTKNFRPHSQILKYKKSSFNLSFNLSFNSSFNSSFKSSLNLSFNLSFKSSFKSSFAFVFVAFAADSPSAQGSGNRSGIIRKCEHRKARHRIVTSWIHFVFLNSVVQFEKRKHLRMRPNVGIIAEQIFENFATIPTDVWMTQRTQKRSRKLALRKRRIFRHVAG